MSHHVLVFRGHTKIFNDLMLYPSSATFCLPPWGHAVAMENVIVSHTVKHVQSPGPWGRGGAGSDCCLLERIAMQ